MKSDITIPTVHPTSFIKVLESGRTKPLLVLCQDDADNEVEVVVKLSTSVDTKKSALVCELLGALLAKDLGLPVADPCLVLVDAEFAKSVPDHAVAEKLRRSEGLNFGSRFLGPGYATWPQGRSVQPALVPVATDILAFDVLIQNPDRRRDKPNLLRRNDELAIFDHELAFSFLYSLVPNEYPWAGKGLDFVRQHVFWDTLRGKDLTLDRFAGALEAIDDARLTAYREAVPESWRRAGTATEVILDYLGKARNNSQKLIQWIKEVLK